MLKYEIQQQTIQYSLMLFPADSCPVFHVLLSVRITLASPSRMTFQQTETEYILHSVC